MCIPNRAYRAHPVDVVVENERSSRRGSPLVDVSNQWEGDKDRQRKRAGSSNVSSKSTGFHTY